jgi:hypothetical protein
VLSPCFHRGDGEVDRQTHPDPAATVMIQP